jgi:hypothetical protein
MSHVAVVDLEIRPDELDDVALACELIGCELMRGQKTYKWYGTSVGDYPLQDGFTKSDLGKCDHAIRVKDGTGAEYEIGLVERDGKLVPLWDFWMGGWGLKEKVGENCKKLKQALATSKAARAAAKLGYRVQRIEEGTKVRLRLTGGRLR